jgi:hypothetical protein
MGRPAGGVWANISAISFGSLITLGSNHAVGHDAVRSAFHSEYLDPSI